MIIIYYCDEKKCPAGITLIKSEFECNIILQRKNNFLILMAMYYKIQHSKEFPYAFGI